jgi:putative FmdB family regulatory protein
MPTYTYQCSKCENVFELFSSIAEYRDTVKCTECKRKAHRMYVQDLLTLNGSVRKGDDELKTIGDLAMRNTERMSADQKAELHAKNNAYKETPSTNPLPKGMTRMKKTKGVKWT